jgi:heptosyltransferase-2
VEGLNPRRIAVFVPNWVGDAVMATPALVALRERFRDAHITGLARPYVKEVLNGADCLDEIRSLESLKDGAAIRAVLADAFAMRSERFDLAVLLANSFRSAVFAAVAGIPVRLGYSREARGMLLTIRVRPAKENGRFVPVPMVDYYLALVASIGAKPVSRRMKLAVTPDEAGAADEILARCGIDRAKPLAVINPGAAFGSAKCWPPENFASVADALSEKGFEVAVETSPREREIGDAIAAAAKRPLKPVWMETIPLGTLKGLIARAAVLITNDSGPRHIGAALGAPVVTIMGPTDPRWSEINYEREIVLRRDVECAPCMLRTCPRDHRCMTLITPDDVVRAAEEVLSRRKVAEVTTR